MKFLVISAGESATDARPILATSDPAVIEAALDAILERAGADPRVPEVMSA
jgi:hypothetical protein